MKGNKEIGKRIKEARENARLTQQELGDLLGLNKSSIQRYESGKIAKIKPPILENIAIALNVNPCWLALKTDDSTYHGERLPLISSLMETANPTINKILLLLKEKNKTQKELTNYLGLDKSVFSQWKSDSESYKKYIPQIAEFFDVSTDYLLNLCEEKKSQDKRVTAQNIDIFSREERNHIKKYRVLDEYGTKAVDSLLNIEYERCKKTTEENEKTTITIKYSLIPASAGSGSFLDDENIEEREYPDTPKARQADIVIPVDGDSMEPVFYDGDELYVRLQPAVNIGEIGIFEQGKKAYVKELGEDRLISLNPDYDDIYPNDYEEMVCIGKVLGKVEN